MGSRVGDIMVLGAADVVFGDPAEVTMPSFCTAGRIETGDNF